MMQVDTDKIDRLAAEIQDKISEHLDREPMKGAEIVLALNNACHKVIDAWLEAGEHEKCHT